MSAIEEYFERVKDHVTFDDFSQRIEEKRAIMGSLCDDDTLCQMVLQELGVGSTKKISEITVNSGKVNLKAKVVSAFEVREFTRDDGSSGKVVNLLLGDETGSIRAVLWDEAADLVKIGEIQKGSNVSVSGNVRSGQKGLEIHIGRGSSISTITDNINVGEARKHQIADISEGMANINLTAKIVSAGSLRFFKRRDGGEGKVKTLTLGDSTGKINLTLWDERAEITLEEGETVDVTHAYARKNNYTGRVELQLGREGEISRSDAVVEYREKTTPIADIEIDNIYSVQGFVSGIGEVREFTRSDGTKGQVANIHVSDDTGRIKATLWGEHANIVDEIDIGSEILISDAQAKTGLGEEIELSLNWNSKIKILQK
jgi:replication factor A1